MEYFRAEKSGFTLVEILVAVSIGLILTGIGIASYNSFNQRETLKQAAESVKSTVRDVQNRALSGEKDCAVCRGADLVCGTADDSGLNYWRFSVTPALQYQINGSCGTPSQTFSQKSYSLSSGLAFRNAVTITYKPLAHGTIEAGSYEIWIDQSATGDSIRISVTSSGEITVGGIE